MRLNPKALALALVAAFAISAIGASAAMAEQEGRVIGADPETGEPVETGFVGEDEEGDRLQITVGGGVVECSVSKIVGEIPEGVAESLTTTLLLGGVQPASQECSAFDLPATIASNGCHLSFETFETAGSDSWQSRADLECPEGKGIEIRVYTGSGHGFKLCTLTLLPQSNLQGVTFHNSTHEGKADDLTATLDIENAAATESGGFCEGHEVVVDLHGSVTLPGIDQEEEPVDLYIEHTETEEHHETGSSDGHIVGAKPETGEHVETFVSGEDKATDPLQLTGAGGTVECATNEFEGEFAGTTKSLTITPTFGGPAATQECTAGGQPMTVTNSGCTLTFDTAQTIEENHDTWKVTTDLICPGNGIEIHLYAGGEHGFTVCTLTVPPQNDLEGVTIHNTTHAGKRHDLTVTVDVEGIKTTEQGDFCPGGSHAEGESSFHGSVTMEGVGPNGPVDLYVATTEGE